MLYDIRTLSCKHTGAGYMLCGVKSRRRQVDIGLVLFAGYFGLVHLELIIITT